MESSPRATGPPLPLSSLRLLVPPLRLVSAWMWQVAEQRNIMHYGKLEEFVTLVTEMVPDLLSYKQTVQLILGLRARFVLELCREEPPAELQTIQPHLDRISQSAETHMQGVNIDPEVETAEGNFVELIQNLLKNTEDRTHFFQEVFPEQYGPKYDAALQMLVSEFLSRLEQLLPVPDFKQTASWLGDDVSSVWEDSLQSVSNPEYLNDLLQHYQCFGHLEKAHSCYSIMGDAIISTLSCPSTIRVVIDYEEANSVGLSSDECMEDGAVKSTRSERDRDGSEGLFDEVEAEEEQGDNSQNEERLSCPSLPEKASSAAARLHTCSRCSKSFTSQSKLKEHTVRRHTGERPFNCNRCGKNFITNWELTKHHQIHSPTDKTKTKTKTKTKSFLCSECGKHFRYSSALKRHGRVHTGRNTSSHSCSQCGKNFRDKTDLRRHQISYGGEGTTLLCGGSEQASSATAQLYKCSQCNRIFRCQSKLVRHEKIHTGERPFNCVKCEKKFITSWDLTKHQRIHSPTHKTKAKSFLCSECGKSFATSRNLKRHETSNTAHKNKSLSCSKCGKSFTRLHDMLRHRVTHTEERPFSCTECGKSYRFLAGLKRHQRIQHTIPGEQPYLCSYCGQSFVRAATLQSHLRTHTHTGEHPYHCARCGKTFKLSHDLKAHKQTHIGERPYSCTDCKKTFKYPADFKRHMYIHTGEKPYQCSQCEMRFTQSGNMKYHQMKYHKNLG